MVKVTLREKKISRGRQSLYLDFYPAIPHPGTGKATRREFLGLYTWDRPKNEPDKLHNRQARTLAEHIRAKRQIEIQNGVYGLHSEAKKKTDFLAYMQKLAGKRRTSEGNYGNWRSTILYLSEYTGGALLAEQITPEWMEGFKAYLLANVSQNTAVSYFGKLLAAVKQAFKDGIFSEDIGKRVDGVKPGETHREFLSLEELQQLARTECDEPLLKRAALFSALTGLRFSDIQKLLWEEIRRGDDGYVIRFRQKKTKGAEFLPISDQARGLLGDQPADQPRVFPDLEYSAWQNGKLREWVLRAGILKKITFHSFRHTYATLQLAAGTDLYTVSKMLGHKDIKTTQIYAKILDKQKRAAADKIKLDLS